MDETDQAFKPDGIIPSEHILALSWNIATRPKLYRELSSNPYSSQALQIISERFSDANTADVIRAVVFAEPEGKYDRNFRQLPKVQQEQELRKQRNASIEIKKRLVQYCKKHTKEFKQLSKEVVYNSLSIVVFASTDVKEIEQKYSQNQRLDFKLSIVNYIEDPQKLTFSLQQRDQILRVLLLVLVFAAFSFILFCYLTQRQTQNITQSSEVKKQILGIEVQKENQGSPVRLTIPVINVNAVIQLLGVTQSGEMEVPSNTIDVGWFKLGPHPGERGSAVIAGHLNGENGKAGVFANLYKLKEGDKLYIEDDKGTSITFVVREKRTYDSGYADDVFSRNDNTYLNLITCDGMWDEIKKSYSKRLVVFTDIMD